MQICCFTCVYCNNSKQNPKCRALNGECDPDNEFCDYTV